MLAYPVDDGVENGSTALQVPVRVTPDPGPLLRLAAEGPDGSHAAAAALDAARRAMWDEAAGALDQIARDVDASEDIDSIAVAARPSLTHPKTSPKKSCGTAGG
ncbi:hypothetical protein ACFZA4_43150 [Streptomyces antimycoticus]|uniref:hypothetical protein n=1 Tax=Streptomyces antimycoticus TaxID=68175 RepID=UPI0036EB6D31